MIITSNLSSIVQRQAALGTYRPDEFVPSPYMAAYWSGHVIEELTEFWDAAIENKPSEAADVLIFLQTYTALLYPKNSLVLNLSKIALAYRPDAKNYLVLIQVLRQNAYNRKSWKSYSSLTFSNFCKAVVAPILGLLLYYVEPAQLLTCYNQKLKYNLSRTDWGLRAKCL